MTQTARTYGQALYELARDEQLTAQLLGEVQMLAQLFRENPQYTNLLTLPSIAKAERCALIDESFRDKIHPYLLNFMKILVEHGTIGQLPDCATHFRALHHRDNGILEATAITAAPLSTALREQLLAKLERVTGKKIELASRVDASVLGGVRLEMDGNCLDGTVQTRLATLRDRLRESVL